MARYRVVYKNGFSKTFEASSQSDARLKAHMEYRSWRKAHPGTYFAGSSVKAEDAGHRISRVERV